jgi:Icc-related predicted phosphoesterase
MKDMRLFFTTDIHGSDICFRKFFAAIREYRVNVALLLGDLSGKVIIPIQQDLGTYTCTVMGTQMVAHNNDELMEMKRKTADLGFYSYVGSKHEIEELQSNQEKNDEVFQTLIAQRLDEWVKTAEEKIRGSTAKMYIGAGNDDLFSIEPVLDSSDLIPNVDEKLVNIEGYEMVSTAYVNPTPWDTPRECSEEDLAKRIEELASQVSNMDSAIFNFHAPPYGTLLDVAPELKDLQPVAGQTQNVGSTAVADSIRKHQPLLGLHGHIHESKAGQKLGRTLCLNPGSEYSEGVLRGVIVNLDKNKVKSYIFTSG